LGDARELVSAHFRQKNVHEDQIGRELNEVRLELAGIAAGANIVAGGLEDLAQIGCLVEIVFDREDARDRVVSLLDQQAQSRRELFEVERLAEVRIRPEMDRLGTIDLRFPAADDHDRGALPSLQRAKASDDIAAGTVGQRCFDDQCVRPVHHQALHRLRTRERRVHIESQVLQLFAKSAVDLRVVIDEQHVVNASGCAENLG
jgi:hypothetical protein